MRSDKKDVPLTDEGKINFNTYLSSVVCGRNERVEEYLSSLDELKMIVGRKDLKEQSYKILIQYISYL